MQTAEDIRDRMGDQEFTLPERDMVALTSLLDQHPEWWSYPCLCASCRSHTEGSRKRSRMVTN